jgi:uncharacterized membrane protein YdbT with pleckstrin-like domain
VAFPKKLLNDDEELVLDLRPHWWFLAGPVLLLIVALAVLSFALAKHNNPARLGAAGFAAIVLLYFVARYLKWTTTDLVLTSDRLVYRSGVIAKRGIEIPLERINTVFSNQSVFERLMRSGDLVVESGGERGQESFKNIPKPAIVQNEIYRQMEANNTRMYGGGRGATSLTVAEQLEKLDALRQRGVLDEAEFEAQKRQLLS